MMTDVKALNASYDKYLAILNQYKYGHFDQEEYPGWMTKWQHCMGAVVLIKWHESEPNKKINTFRALSREEAKIIANSITYRWIKLSEAKAEELPVDFERIEVLTEDTQSRQDGMYNPSVAMYRFENNQHTFYPMFTWSVLEMVLDNPEQARKIYADKVYLSVKNVIYFRHINREDLPEYVPRERRKVEF